MGHADRNTATSRGSAMLGARILGIALAKGLALPLALAAGVTAAPAPAATDPAALIEQGHWKEARALLEPRVAASPGDGEAARELAQVRMAYRDLTGAQQLAEKAVALDSKDARAHEVLAMVLGQRAQSAGCLASIPTSDR